LDERIKGFITEVPPEHRALFERLHGIVLATHPEAQEDFAYAMPTYRVGKRRLNIGVWRHGVSVYGWRRDNDGGFAERHPDLLSSKSTIRIRPSDADAISDEDFRGLVAGALDP
jgi:uncharacterized protein YdhG (YjbR/CyaY superfamily)